MTRFGWRADITDYGRPRFGCRPDEWLALCRLHQSVGRGERSEWDVEPAPPTPQLLFARYLRARGDLHEEVA